MNLVPSPSPSLAPVSTFRPVMAWIEANPGNHGKNMPRRLREDLRSAEARGLIAWSLGGGWIVTQHGVDALRRFN